MNGWGGGHIKHNAAEGTLEREASSLKAEGYYNSLLLDDAHARATHQPFISVLASVWGTASSCQ